MEQFNFRDNLAQMRENFNTLGRKAEKPPQTLWLALNPEDPLNKMYDEWDDLMANGRVCYAHIVQANTLLYKKIFATDSCAEIVIGYDSYFDKNAEELRNIAFELFKLKNAENVSEEYKHLASLITDEEGREFNVLIPDSLACGHELYLSVLAVFVNQLPRSAMRGEILPVICSPKHLQTTAILPKKYWTKDFKKLFLSK